MTLPTLLEKEQRRHDLNLLFLRPFEKAVRKYLCRPRLAPNAMSRPVRFGARLPELGARTTEARRDAQVSTRLS
jgi:hypothetical protein